MPMTLSQLRQYYLPVVVAVCVTLIAVGGSDLAELFRFDREAILHGQIWRLLSGHLVHLGWSHTGLNIAGLALIWALLGGTFTNRQWMSMIIGSALGISLGLLAFNPELSWYVGFSGVLHGMLMAGAISEIRSGRRSSYALLILVIVKLAWEQIVGPLPGSEASAGGAVIIDAHLYGALCGILWGRLLKPRLRRE